MVMQKLTYLMRRSPCLHMHGSALQFSCEHRWNDHCVAHKGTSTHLTEELASPHCCKSHCYRKVWYNHWSLATLQ